MNLTIQEINQLLEAIDAWEKEPMRNGFTDGMLGAMLNGLGPKEGSQEERAEKFERETKQRIERSTIEERVRKESAILLKAKLITMRNELTAEMSSATAA